MSITEEALQRARGDDAVQTGIDEVKWDTKALIETECVSQEKPP